jgi:glutamate/tyrosine decarboxylase-like PLP-dependent enzyme
LNIVAERFGFNVETADGCFNPGGSMANFVGFIAARHLHFPHVREDGWQSNDRPVAFTSYQSHYSLKRAAMMSGMGMKNIRYVPSDRKTGSMIPEALEEAIV